VYTLYIASNEPAPHSPSSSFEQLEQKNSAISAEDSWSSVFFMAARFNFGEVTKNIHFSLLYRRFLSKTISKRTTNGQTRSN
jgi:hypothetical protein